MINLPRMLNMLNMLSMLIVSSRNGVPVRVTGERWRHIVSRHPIADRLTGAILRV